MHPCVACAFAILFVGITKGSFINLHTKSKTIWSQENIFLTCLKNVSTPSVIMAWFGPTGNQISSDTSKRVHTQATDEPMGIRLIILEADKEDAGFYECRAYQSPTDYMPLESRFLKINVFNSMHFWGFKHTDYSVEGDLRHPILCRVILDPNVRSIQMKWLFNGIPIPTNLSSRKYRMTETYGDNKASTSLTIKNLTREDMGVYTCDFNAIISDTFYQMRHYDTFLDIEYPPKYPKGQEIVWIQEKHRNQTVNVTCRVDANPPARFSWFTQDGTSLKTFHNQVLDILSPENNLSVLKLRFLPPAEMRNKHIFYRHENQLDSFVCRTDNHRGHNELDIQVKAVEKPGTPQILSHNYTRNRLSLKLDERKYPTPVQKYKVVIYKEIAIEVDVKDTDNGEEGGSRRIDLPVDLPSGDYKISVYAQSPIGWSSFHPNATRHLSVGGDVNRDDLSFVSLPMFDESSGHSSQPLSFIYILTICIILIKPF